MFKSGKIPPIEGYQSPIVISERLTETIARDLRNQKGNIIVAEIRTQLGVTVDKDELIRALQYDRRQYDVGYANGVEAGRAEVAREIFAEIYEDCIDQFGYMNYEAFYKLKRKYTEEDT